MKRFSSQQIVEKLRQVDVELGKGFTVPESELSIVSPELVSPELKYQIGMEAPEDVEFHNV